MSDKTDYRKLAQELTEGCRDLMDHIVIKHVSGILEEMHSLVREQKELRQQLAESEARVAELEATLYHGNLEREKCQKAMILRKQAEAVEPAIRTALHNLGNADITEEDIRVFAEQYAQRLRNQADELEKAGGE